MDHCQRILGSKPGFLAGLIDRRQYFVVEVPKSFRGWRQPHLQVTDSATKPSTAENLAKHSPSLASQAQERYTIKSTQKGDVVWEARSMPFAFRDGKRIIRDCQLIVTRNVLEPDEVKYFVAYPPAGMPLPTRPTHRSTFCEILGFLRDEILTAWWTGLSITRTFKWPDLFTYSLALDRPMLCRSTLFGSASTSIRRFQIADDGGLYKLIVRNPYLLQARGTASRTVPAPSKNDHTEMLRYAAWRMIRPWRLLLYHPQMCKEGVSCVIQGHISTTSVAPTEALKDTEDHAYGHTCCFSHNLYRGPQC